MSDAPLVAANDEQVSFVCRYPVFRTVVNRGTEILPVTLCVGLSCRRITARTCLHPPNPSRLSHTAFSNSGCRPGRSGHEKVRCHPHCIARSPMNATGVISTIVTPTRIVYGALVRHSQLGCRIKSAMYCHFGQRCPSHQSRSLRTSPSKCGMAAR